MKMPMRTTEEMNWRQRTAIIFFLLHPLLGNNDETACCSIFNVNKNTLQGWLHKQGMRFRWRKYIDKYTVKSVMDYMGEKWKQCSKFKVLTSKQMDEKLPNHTLHKYRCKEAGREILFFSSDGISVQQKVARAKRKKDQYVFLKVDQKRAHTNLDRKTGKYAMEKQWVASELCSGWNVGFPLTTAELSRRLRQEFFEGSLFDAHMLKNDNKTLNQWLRRAVDDAGFSSRCASFALKIPIGWDRLAKEGARRVRNNFKKANVNVVINADEINVKFHETTKTVLAVKGEKRIGVARKFDEKDGCTVMVAMEMKTGELLQPFIIFTGKFGKTLMEYYKPYKKSKIITTENHWMTEHAMRIWLDSIRQMFPGRRIGIT
ncbi:MAG: hypothetical protein ACREBR_03315, partial [bacterium]